MTLKEIKDYIEGIAEDIMGTQTNVNGISLIKEGTMNPVFCFRTAKWDDIHNALTMKAFTDLLIQMPDFFINDLITNIKAFKLVMTDDGKSTFVFTIAEGEDKSLTGMELKEALNTLSYEQINGSMTNVECYQMLTEGSMKPKLVINRPDLMDRYAQNTKMTGKI